MTKTVEGWTSYAKSHFDSACANDIGGGFSEASIRSDLEFGEGLFADDLMTAIIQHDINRTSLEAILNVIFQENIKLELDQRHAYLEAWSDLVGAAIRVTPRTAMPT